LIAEYNSATCYSPIPPLAVRAKRQHNPRRKRGRLFTDALLKTCPVILSQLAKKLFKWLENLLMSDLLALYLPGKDVI
jgi:hypothetical protein